MPTTDADVVVVGGGIAGLTAAWELCRFGLSVRLFERQSECGGLIRTDRVGDFVIDAGPDTLLGHKPAALALCHALGLDGFIVRPLTPRTTHVVRNHRLCALPETSALGFPTQWTDLITSRAFTLGGKLRMAIEPLIPATPQLPDESIASFVRRRFGREALTYLAEPVLAGIHRGDAAKLSVHALFPSLVEAERKYGSVVRAWRRTASVSGKSASVSLATGLQQLVERLRAALPLGVVTTGSEVRSVEIDRSLVLRLADGHTIRARAVVLAVPAHAAARLVTSLDPVLAAQFCAIPFASAVTVALGYERAAVRHPLAGWGFVVPASERRRITAASWVSSKWPGRVPTDHVLIRASVGGAHDSSADVRSDETLIKWAHDDLRDVLRIDSAPMMARVYRWPHAIPQLEIGHRDLLARIEHHLARVPGLHITGSGFRGVGISDCVADAQAVARAVHELLVPCVVPDRRQSG